MDASNLFSATHPKAILLRRWWMRGTNHVGIKLNSRNLTINQNKPQSIFPEFGYHTPPPPVLCHPVTF